MFIHDQINDGCNPFYSAAAADEVSFYFVQMRGRIPGAVRAVRDVLLSYAAA